MAVCLTGANLGGFRIEVPFCSTLSAERALVYAETHTGLKGRGGTAVNVSSSRRHNARTTRSGRRQVAKPENLNLKHAGSKQWAPL